MTRPINFTEIKKQFNNEMTKRQVDLNKCNHTGQAFRNIRTKCARPLWKLVLDGIKRNNPPNCPFVKEQLEKSAYRDDTKAQYAKSFRELVYDYNGDFYNLEELHDWLENKKTYTTQKTDEREKTDAFIKQKRDIFKNHKNLLLTIFHNFGNQTKAYIDTYTRLESKFTGKDNQSVQQTQQQVQVSVETPSEETKTEETETEIIYNPDEQDIVIVAMNILPWKY